MTEDNDAKARQTAHGLIQGHIRSDHKVINMKAFYTALVQALKQARQKGRDEIQDRMCSGLLGGRLLLHS